ncbi:MAG: hypothetical protein IJO48_05365 [Clostridia bacterium]|nr:hypothetical protein [Clostridia bacterium]
MKYTLSKLIISVLAVAFLILITGCTTEKKPLQEPLKIQSFSFSHHGTSSESFYTYSIEKTEKGAQICVETLSDTYTTNCSEDILKDLSDIATEYRLDLWNGFKKSNQHILDGEGFSLSITLQDGSIIDAHGSNTFPENYYDAEIAINKLFEQFCEY